ncbi:movement protein [Sesamum angolense]|uniref:Movement protein n=1 Tax=Sesamum angolense TaxID=2727404 RepID=A0AAE1T877_9LAMI|nr:movement protein [Sesamum angolense]
MDLQPSQNNYSEEDRLQTSESLSGFFSRMTVSNKTMERIMRQDSNLSPYDGFRIGGIGKLMFDIHPRITYNLADQDFSRVLTLHQDFKRKDLMKEGNRPYSITYRIAYALSNTHHSDLFLRKEYIEIPKIFKEFAKVMTPDPIRIPRIGGVDIVIKDHPVLDRTMSSRTEFSSRMSFSEDRIIGYKGKEKDLSKVLTPQEIRVDNVKLRCPERWKEIQVIFDITKNENIFPCDDLYHLPQPVVGRYEVSSKITNHGEENGTATGLIDSDSFYKESEEEIENLREALEELKTMDISEEIKLFLENVKRLIQRNFSENPLAWWDRNKIEATLKIKEECKYYSPGFLVRNHGEIKRGKPRSILWRKSAIFQTYSKEAFTKLLGSESTKWKWEEIHTQRVRELKQVCNNLPKLAIPQDEDHLVVYTDANDYRWAAVLMKKTTTGEEPCRYTGGLFTEQQTKVWHINEKEFFAVWKAFKKWHLFLLAKEFTLKVDNTNVRAFLKNKLESKIEKAQMEASEANSIMLRLRHLRENLEELNKKFGRLAVNAQVAGQIQRVDLDTVQIAIRTTMVASTSLWNDLQEPIRKASSSEMTNQLSPDSGVTATNESQGVQTFYDSSQPSASGVKEEEISLRTMTCTSKANTNELSSSSSAWQVYQRMWEKLISRKGINPSKTVIETSEKYNRVWMMEGSKPEEVREWYEFGALASVHTMSPSFPEISKLPDWISGARPDMVAFNRIKAASEEAPLVSAISEDDISTRRA